MPRVTWPLLNDCPSVQVVLMLGGQPAALDLLADTGAGRNSSPFDLILGEGDCWLCGLPSGSTVALSGALTGTYTLYKLRVQIPALAFDRILNVVGVPNVPDGFS